VQKEYRKEKTLYVSDLDGTLLRSDETLSDYTCEVINRLTEEGVLFSYATARSVITARKATKGLNAKIPVIVYNGAFVIDNVSGEVLLSNYFGTDAEMILQELLEYDVRPIVYSLYGGRERFCYVVSRQTEGMKFFVESRKGDPRETPVSWDEELFGGDIFYFSCIDEPEKLLSLYERFQEKHHCIYHKDIYSGAQWLEILPVNASKANAVMQLKRYLNCEKVVAFGDGKNDMDMFEMADSCYAVSNAVEELKAVADGVIGSNNDDSVAKWLEQQFAAGKN